MPFISRLTFFAVFFTVIAISTHLNIAAAGLCGTGLSNILQCYNGSTCVPTTQVSDNSPICACVAGTTGAFCQDTVSFTTISPNPSVPLTFSLSTNQPAIDPSDDNDSRNAVLTIGIISASQSIDDRQDCHFTLRPYSARTINNSFLIAQCSALNVDIDPVTNDVKYTLPLFLITELFNSISPGSYNIILTTFITLDQNDLQDPTQSLPLSTIQTEYVLANTITVTPPWLPSFPPNSPLCDWNGTNRVEINQCFCNLSSGYFGPLCDIQFVPEASALFYDSITGEINIFHPYTAALPASLSQQFNLVYIPHSLIIDRDGLVISPNAKDYSVPINSPSLCPTLKATNTVVTLMRLALLSSDNSLTITRTDSTGTISSLPILFAPSAQDSAPIRINCNSQEQINDFFQSKASVNSLRTGGPDGNLVQMLHSCYLPGTLQVHSLPDHPCVCKDNYVGFYCHINLHNDPYYVSDPSQLGNPIIDGQRFVIAVKYLLIDGFTPSQTIISAFAQSNTVGSVEKVVGVLLPDNFISFSLEQTLFTPSYNINSGLETLSFDIHLSITHNSDLSSTYVVIYPVILKQFQESYASYTKYITTEADHSYFTTSRGFMPCAVSGTVDVLINWYDQVTSAPIEVCTCHPGWIGPFCSYKFTPLTLAAPNGVFWQYTLDSPGEYHVDNLDSLCHLKLYLDSTVIRTIPCFFLADGVTTQQITFTIPAMPDTSIIPLTSQTYLTFLDGTTMIQIKAHFGPSLSYTIPPARNTPFFQSTSSPCDVDGTLFFATPCVCKSNYFGRYCHSQFSIVSTTMTPALGMNFAVGDTIQLVNVGYTYTLAGEIGTDITFSDNVNTSLNDDGSLQVTVLSGNSIRYYYASDPVEQAPTGPSTYTLFLDSSYNSVLQPSLTTESPLSPRCAHGGIPNGTSSSTWTCTCPAHTFGTRCQYSIAEDPSNVFGSLYSGQFQLMVTFQYDNRFTEELTASIPATTLQIAVIQQRTVATLTATVANIFFSHTLERHHLRGRAALIHTSPVIPQAYVWATSPLTFTLNAIDATTSISRTIMRYAPSILSQSTSYYHCYIDQTLLDFNQLNKVVLPTLFAAEVRYGLDFTIIAKDSDEMFLLTGHCKCVDASWDPWCRTGMVLQNHPLTSRPFVYSPGRIFTYSLNLPTPISSFIPYASTASRFSKCQVMLSLSLNPTKYTKLGDCHFIAQSSMLEFRLPFTFDDITAQKITLEFEGNMYSIVSGIIPDVTARTPTSTCNNVGYDIATPLGLIVCHCDDRMRFGRGCAHKFVTSVTSFAGLTPSADMAPHLATLQKDYVLVSPNQGDVVTFSVVDLNDAAEIVDFSVFFSSSPVSTDLPNSSLYTIDTKVIGSYPSLSEQSSVTATIQGVRFASPTQFVSPRRYRQLLIDLINADSTNTINVSQCFEQGTATYDISQFIQDPLSGCVCKTGWTGMLCQYYFETQRPEDKSSPTYTFILYTLQWDGGDMYDWTIGPTDDPNSLSFVSFPALVGDATHTISAPMSLAVNTHDKWQIANSNAPVTILDFTTCLTSLPTGDVSDCLIVTFLLDQNSPIIDSQAPPVGWDGQKSFADLPLYNQGKFNVIINSVLLTPMAIILKAPDSPTILHTFFIEPIDKSFSTVDVPDGTYVVFIRMMDSLNIMEDVKLGTTTISDCPIMHLAGFCQNPAILGCDLTALYAAVEQFHGADFTYPSWCICQTGSFGPQCEFTLPHDLSINSNLRWSTTTNQQFLFSNPDDVIAQINSYIAGGIEPRISLSNSASQELILANLVLPTMESLLNFPFDIAFTPITLHFDYTIPSAPLGMDQTRFAAIDSTFLHIASPTTTQITSVKYNTDPQTLTVTLIPPPTPPPSPIYYTFHIDPNTIPLSSPPSSRPILFSTIDGFNITMSQHFPSTLFDVVDSPGRTGVWTFTIHVPPHGALLNYNLRIYSTSTASDLGSIALISEMRSSCASSLVIPESCDQFNPIPITTTSDVCGLKCPTLMNADETCERCVCYTQTCSAFTVAGMIYLEPGVYRESVYNSILPSVFLNDLKLNRLPEALAISADSTAKIIGIESVDIIPMSKTTTDFTMLQLYITISPFLPEMTTTTQLEDRFMILFNRYKTLVSLDATTPAFTYHDHTNFPLYYGDIRGIAFPDLKFTTQVTTPSQFVSPPLVLPNTQSSQSFLTTRCVVPDSDNNSTPARGRCPRPNVIASKFWFTTFCPTSYLYLIAVCYDIFRNQIIYQDGSASWCGSGFPEFPLALQRSCSTSPVKPPSPSLFPPFSALSVTTARGTTSTALKPLIPAVINLSERVIIHWTYKGQYGYAPVAIYLIGAMYISAVRSYRILLTTSIASAEEVSVFIPMNIQTGLSVQFLLEFTQNTTANPGPTHSFIVNDGINRCDVINPPNCDLTTQFCNPYSGICECQRLFAPSLIYPSRCEPVCDEPCQNGSTCTIASDGKSTECINCPIGFSGKYCQLSTICDQLSPRCLHGGYYKTITTDRTIRCNNVCTCPNHWTGTTCNECTTTSLPCDPVGTLPSSWDIKGQCDQCYCKYGYSGEFCQFRSMYGSAIFNGIEATKNDKLSVLDLEQPFSTLTYYTTPQYEVAQRNVNIFSNLLTVHNHISMDTTPMAPLTEEVFLSIEGRIVLESDLALSLNVDISSISLLRLTRVWNNETLQVFTQSSSSPQQKSDSINALFHILSTTTNPLSLTILQNDANDDIPDDNSPITDLYQKWLDMKNHVNNNLNSSESQVTPTPIEGSDAEEELGDLEAINDGYDPNCDQSEQLPEENHNSCPPGNDPFSFTNGGNSGLSPGTTALVVIVPVIIVLTIFTGTTTAVIVCKKKKKYCFKPPKDRISSNDNAHLDLSNGNELTHVSTTVELSVHTSKVSKTSKSAVKSSKHVLPSGSNTMGLVPVKDDEELAEGWVKMKHTGNGDIFYVNDAEMISQRHKPGQDAPNQYNNRNPDW